MASSLNTITKIEASPSTIKKIKKLICDENENIYFDLICPIPDQIKNSQLASDENTNRNFIAYYISKLKNYDKTKALKQLKLIIRENESEESIIKPLLNKFKEPLLTTQWKKEHPKLTGFDETTDQKEIGKILFNNLTKYKAYDWYEWCLINWGSRFNPSKFKISESFIEFESITHPQKIINLISEKLPKKELLVSYANESLSEIGSYSIKNMKIKRRKIHSAYDLYKSLEF